MKLNSEDQKYSNLNENSSGILNHRLTMTQERISELKISGKCPNQRREKNSLENDEKRLTDLRTQASNHSNINLM